MKEWYEIENAGEVDSPALLVYRDRVLENIALAKETGGGVSTLRPHVKTHKMAGITKLMLQAGIDRFKCATIAEAEMLAEAGAKDILLAYQPTAVKAPRFLSLARSWPGTRFACLVDNPGTARMLSELLGRQASGAGGISSEVYIDLNVGMDRTGVKPAGAAGLYRECLRLGNLRVAGLHAYDGHIHDPDPGVREQRAGRVFETAQSVREALELERPQGTTGDGANGQVGAGANGRAGEKPLGLVIGGSPTFPFHAQRKGVETSPGTFVFWDEGYRRMLPEQDFRYAALLLTRIISRIDEHTFCLDLGYKSVASENPLDRRVVFPGHPGTEILGHSEEHLVVRVPRGSRHEIGDCWYGVPYHVCPTVALYEAAHVITGNTFTEKWKVTARDRQITI